MKLSDIDFTKKENQTFKNWFKLMWANTFIQIFGGSIILGVIILTANFDERISYLTILIPISMFITVVYEGFYKFWKEICNFK